MGLLRSEVENEALAVMEPSRADTERKLRSLTPYKMKCAVNEAYALLLKEQCLEALFEAQGETQTRTLASIFEIGAAFLILMVGRERDIWPGRHIAKKVEREMLETAKRARGLWTGKLAVMSPKADS